MLNRHGLVAGATGTGKTKSLQVLVTAGALYIKYATPIDRASAHEIITARIAAAAQQPAAAAPAQARVPGLNVVRPVQALPLHGSTF